MSSDETIRGKAFAHPLRVRIVRALAAGEGESPNALAKVLGEPLGNVSYHMKQLADFGAVECWKTEPRRGAVEHFYRLTGALEVPGDVEDRAKKAERTLGRVAKEVKRFFEVRGDDEPPCLEFDVLKTIRDELDKAGLDVGPTKEKE
jgi:DNA-binding transcriptional ArsR family regulator